MNERINLPNKILALDVESNGHYQPEIIELSILAINSGEINWPPLTWTIKPQNPIEKFATNIHGISNEHVVNCKSIFMLKEDISSVLRDHPVIAHNAHIDFKLLKHAFPDWKPAVVYDTLRLSKVLVPNLHSYSLSNLIIHFDLTKKLKLHGLHHAHRANYDTAAVALLFSALVNEAKGQEIGIQQILQISKTSLTIDTPEQRNLF